MGELNTENEVKKIKHYHSSHKILLVGEGDFSFSACLARTFGSASNMVATSLDSKDSLLNKYGSVTRNLKELEDLGCSIVHEVDANTMSRHPFLHVNSFDRIVFNFPHAGFLYRESESRQIKLHRDLVRGFLRNAKEMLSEKGQIHITHKISYPFYKWDIKKQGKKVGLSLVEVADFNKSDYPGYVNKKGSGSKSNKTFPLGDCSTFKFVNRDPNRASIDSLISRLSNTRI